MKVFKKVSKWMEEVRNLDKKRVFDICDDNKVIEICRQNCVTTITANPDMTMNISHYYKK